jgi:hypothetical protein
MLSTIIRIVIAAVCHPLADTNALGQTVATAS